MDTWLRDDMRHGLDRLGQKIDHVAALMDAKLMTLETRMDEKLAARAVGRQGWHYALCVVAIAGVSMLRLLLDPSP